MAPWLRITGLCSSTTAATTRVCILAGSSGHKDQAGSGSSDGCHSHVPLLCGALITHLTSHYTIVSYVFTDLEAEGIVLILYSECLYKQVIELHQMLFLYQISNLELREAFICQLFHRRDALSTSMFTLGAILTISQLTLMQFTISFYATTGCNTTKQKLIECFFSHLYYRVCFDHKFEEKLQS